VVGGGPAARAGVRPGDALLAVDGTEAGALTSGRLAELVRGQPGTAVRLRLDRPGAGSPVEVAIERAELDVQPVEGRLLTLPGTGPGGGQTVGYVVLREFTRAAESAF